MASSPDRDRAGRAVAPGPRLRLSPASATGILALALAIVLGFGALGVVWLLARPLALVFLALTIAESLRPIVRYLARGMPRGLAVASVYLVLALLAALAGWFLVPIAIEQGQQFLDRAPQLLDRVQGWLQSARQAIGLQEGGQGGSLVSQAGQYLISLPMTLGASLLEALIVVFLSLYWLLESPKLWEFVRSLLPPGTEARTAKVLGHVSRAMGGYVRGAAIDGLVVGALAATALGIAGIDYPIALGVVAAIAELVPYVGPIVAGGLATVVGLLESPWHGLLAALVFLALQQIEGHVLTPTIMRSQTAVSATVVIIALLAGGSVGGILGALTAVPLAAAVRTLVTDVIAPALREASHHGAA